MVQSILCDKLPFFQIFYGFEFWTVFTRMSKRTLVAAADDLKSGLFALKKVSRRLGKWDPLPVASKTGDPTEVQNCRNAA